MKQLKLRMLVSVLMMSALGGVFAGTNWYNNGGDVKDVSSWTNAQGDVCAAFSPTDIYWIINAAQGPNYHNLKDIKNLCLGSPSDSPSGFLPGRLACKVQNRIMTVDNFVWFNGSLYSGYKKQSWLEGTAKLVKETPEVIHQVYNNVTDGSMGLNMNLVADDPSIVLHIGGAGKTLDYNAMMKGYIQLNAYFTLRGDNSGFRGSYSVESPYQTVWLGGMDALGDPETPNASAMTLCNNAAIGFQSSVSQSTTRGIRLDGDQAYIVAFSDQADTTGFVCRYPISKTPEAVGRLVKDGSGLVTLDCDYSAGPIRVAGGTLVLGEHATFPGGQQLIICDGASVISHVSTAGFEVSYDGSGTGTLTYKAGYRQGASGLECRVGVSTEGPGVCDAAMEVWVPVNGTKTLTATPESGKVFLNWKGAVGALKDREVFSPSVTLQAFESDENLVAVFGDAAAVPANFTDTDGTTFAFADNVMTVTVPIGVTSSYAYAPLLESGYVHEIVKAGAGALQLAAVPNYVGDFTIREGYAILAVAGALGAPNAGTVDVRSGAAIRINTSDVVASGKVVKLAGEGLGPGDADQGALRGVVGDALGIVGTFELMDAATVVAETSAKFFTGSVVRVHGRVLTVRTPARYSVVDIRDAVFSNDSSTAAQLNLVGKATKFYTSDCRFEGLGEVAVGNDCRCHILGECSGNWPISVEGAEIHMASFKNQDPSQLQMKWSGGANIPNGKKMKVGSSNVATDSVVGLGGVVSGEGELIIQGGWLHWYSLGNTFAGKFSAERDSDAKNKLRTTLVLHDGSAFRCEDPMEFKDADLRLSDGTAFDLPVLCSTTNDCSIVGGARGDSACGRPTIAAIDFAEAGAGAGTLLVDSPVAVTGLTRVARGTLKLGASSVPYLPYTSERLPVFANLVFEANTAFDLSGNDLTLVGFSGFPTMQNAGTLSMTGDMRLTADDVSAETSWNFGSAAVVFGANAKIVIDDRKGKPSRKTRYTILTAEGGITGTPIVQNVVRTSNWVTEIDATGKKLEMVYKPKGFSISVK